jgi:hypothetical protein
MNDDRLHDPIECRVLKDEPWRLIVSIGEEVIVIGRADAERLCAQLDQALGGTWTRTWLGT